jgi:nucleoside-diphosphate-sugar epimerase
VAFRVAVTGATGFIGRQLTAHCAARGFEVRAVVRPPAGAAGDEHQPLHAGHAASSERTSPRVTPAGAGPRPAAAISHGRRPAIAYGLHPGVVVVPAALETTALTDAFRGVDGVVHLAGVVSTVREDDYTRVNVAGTRAVAEAARAVHARLVHVSSLAAAGPASPSRPRSEQDPPAPITPYGRSKLESERAVADVDGLSWIVLRPGVVYGPGDRALLPLFRSARSLVLPLIGRPGAAYTFIHVADLIRTIVAALATGVDHDTIFVGSPAPVTARELLEGVRAATGARALIMRIPWPLTRLAAAAGDVAGAARGRPLPWNTWRYRELYAEGFVCRVDRLRERLGIVAQVDLRDGLAEAAAWYSEQRWI